MLRSFGCLWVKTIYRDKKVVGVFVRFRASLGWERKLSSTGLACYRSHTFNTTTCIWDVTGTQNSSGWLVIKPLHSIRQPVFWDVTKT
jgi:hypothetical protein